MDGSLKEWVDRVIGELAFPWISLSRGSCIDSYEWDAASARAGRSRRSVVHLAGSCRPVRMNVWCLLMSLQLVACVPGCFRIELGMDGAFVGLDGALPGGLAV